MSRQKPAPPLSPKERALYYHGLPSQPVLVARTSTSDWKTPVGVDARLRRKGIWPVGAHALLHLHWEDRLGPEIQRLLDAKDVQTSAIDVVRIGFIDESDRPIVLWIGVLPDTISVLEGSAVVHGCLEVLRGYGISDVEVEMRESLVTRLNNRDQGLPACDRIDYDASYSMLWDAVTTSVGLPICATSRPWIEGTGGFFVRDANDPKKIVFVTARHNVLADHDTLVKHDPDSGEPEHLVQLLGDKVFEDLCDTIAGKIEVTQSIIYSRTKRIEHLKDSVEPGDVRSREIAAATLATARAALPALEELSVLVKSMSDPKNRSLGHVILSPPIGYNVGIQGYTEDWAAIEVYAHQINARNFRGNMLNVQKSDSSPSWHKDMWPLMHTHEHEGEARCFSYPSNNLLKLQGIISDEELSNPVSLDRDMHQCRTVLKRGAATGLTIGRVNSLCSYSRCRLANGTRAPWSKEWPILCHERSESKTFAKRGDSGAVIVDGRGRIVGLLTGGNGETPDIAYMTPISFLLERMMHFGLDARLA